MEIFYLPLKKIYFEQILAGDKFLEFRLSTPYCRKRLEHRTYDGIIIIIIIIIIIPTLGYPAAGDISKRFYRQWRGYFGKDPSRSSLLT